MSLEVICALCAKYWNPIGVPMEFEINEAELGYRPLSADEYDRYLKHVEKLLNQNATDQQILAYLETVERDYLGLSGPAGDKVEFVTALRKIRP